jgi:phosphate-selective porin OprO/OprP
MHLTHRLGRVLTGPAHAALLAAAALLLAGGAARAQQRMSDEEMRALILQQQEQIRALTQAVQELQKKAPAAPSPAPAETGSDFDDKVKKIAGDIIQRKQEEDKKKKEEDDKKKKKDEEEAKKAEGFVVGSDPKLNVSWGPGGFFFQSANDDFRVHIGGRMQSDQVYFTQSPQLKASSTPAAGSPLPLFTGVGPGLGDLEDGFFFRRLRFVADGYIFQTVEWKVEFDFENYNSLTFDECYIGTRDLPFIDTVRIGQMHVPFGLEAYTSSRWLPQMERSPLFDAFYQEFAPGVFTNTTLFDKHMTVQTMFHRIDNFNQFNGDSFGDGRYAYTARTSVLPLYEWDGRCLLHLGLAYQFRKGANPQDFNSGTTLPSNPTTTNNTDLVRFRTRMGLRDAIGQEGDGVRIVDTGNIIAKDVQSVNGELLWYLGPLWVQAEYCVAHTDEAFYPASNKATHRGNLNYSGEYIQMGYFLTGENRGYDTRFGKADRTRLLERFFLVRNEDGGCCYGLGAWELTYRYGFVNLDSDRVLGGRYGEHTVGLNWYWTDSIRIQFNYINGERTVPAPAFSGNVQGFGVRASLEF